MKKILSLLVCFAMLFTFVSVLPASAETTLEKDSDGYYLIYTADDYVAFVEAAKADLSINGKLMADIDMAGDTVAAIGMSNSAAYTGIFDGAGHVIRNLSITKDNFTDTTDTAVAMFSRTQGATIKNLGLEGAKIRYTKKTGGVFMAALVASANATTIEGCFVKNSEILSTQNTEYIQAAGPIASFIDATTVVKNCYAVGNKIGYSESGGNFTSSGRCVSGFVGYTSSKATEESIVNCYAKGNQFYNCPAALSKSGFARKGTSGYTDLKFTNSYTDQLTGYDAESSMNKLATDAAEWKTLASTLGDADTWKNDETGINYNAPRLAWEEDPEQVTEYNVTVAEGIIGGSVAPSVEKAAAGEKVTLTVTPDFNYEVDEVKFNDTVITEEDGVYSFEMPEAEVTVTATFRQILEVADGYYLISDADDYLSFVALANKDLTINGKLMADIDLTGKTVKVIGTGSAFYSGTFDGNGHVIRNLTISQIHKNDSTKFVGMFSKTDNAVIKNLGLENASIRQPGGWNKSSTLVGGFAGQLSGTTSLENCYVKNSSILNANESDCPASGIGALTGSVGSDAAVKNCYVIGTTVGYVEGSSYPTGGIAVGPICGYVGKNGTSNTIQNCYAANNTVQASGGRKTNFCRFGYDEASSSTAITFTFCYTDIPNGESNWDTATVLTATELRAASLLGNGFKTDFYAANGGFPMLAWESTAGLVKDIDFVYSGTVTENGAITKIKLEKADDTALTGKLYAAVFSGDALSYVKLAVIDACTAGVNEVDIEDITLSEGEALKVFVWDNTLVPLMYAVN